MSHVLFHHRRLKYRVIITAVAICVLILEVVQFCNQIFVRNSGKENVVSHRQDLISRGHFVENNYRTTRKVNNTRTGILRKEQQMGQVDLLDDIPRVIWRDNNRPGMDDFAERFASIDHSAREKVSKMLYSDHMYVGQSNMVSNPFDYGYVINDEAKCEEGLNILIYVHTALNNVEKRNAIRTTWAREERLSKLNAVLLFFVGISSDDRLMRVIKRESDTFRDIIQEDYIDSYRNLTLKAGSALKWISIFCKNASFILKLDDDMFVNTFRLMDFIKDAIETRYLNTNKVALCRVFSRMSPIRDPTSKWFVPRSEYGLNRYPTYCCGWVVLMSPMAARALYHAMYTTNFFWIDDVYMTGMLRQKAGVVLANIRKNVSTKYVPNEAFGRSYWDNVIFVSASVSDMYKIWSKMTTLYAQT